MVGTILKNPLEGYENRFAGNYSIVPEDRIAVDLYTGGFLVATWNNSAWVEGATPEEIAAYNKSLVPATAPPLRFRVALINFGIMPSMIDAAIASMPPGEQKERLFALWNFADYLERADPNLIYMASQFEVNSEQLDALFIASKQPV